MSNVTKYKKNGATWYKGICGICDTKYTFKHGNKLNSCPNPECRSNIQPNYIEGIWNKPPTEIKLFELQEQYLKKINMKAFYAYAEEIKKPEDEQNEKTIQRHIKNMDKKILLEMYNLVKKYSASLIKKRMKEKGFHLSRDEFKDKVYQTTFLWYEQFTKRPGFKIDESWAGQLGWKITEALYKYKNEEQNDSLDKVVSDTKGGKKTSLLEMYNTLHMESLFSKSIDDPYDTTYDIITEIGKVLLLISDKGIKDNNKNSLKDSLLSLIAFRLFIEKKDKKLDTLYNIYGNYLKENTEKIKMIVRHYLRDINKV